MFEGDGLETLDLKESLRLLSSSLVGRLVFTDQTLPVVVPVNFAVDGEAVVIQMGAQSSLGATVHGSVLAFQADEVDLVGRSGWTVSAVGEAELVTDPTEAERLAGLLPGGYGSVRGAPVLRVRLGVVHGLRIAAGRAAPASPTTGLVPD